MSKVNKLFPVFMFFAMFAHGQESARVIARQGQVSFFSYTSVEHIKAENNQVLGIIDLTSGEIAVSMLMNAFIFEKALMREHFNESYVESDIYPKASFEGQIQGFDSGLEGEQTRIVKGNFSMHGVTKVLEIKTKIERKDQIFVLSGTFEALVQDYQIKIPPLLAGNIAKTISVDFRFECEPYAN
ncbi:YceI family protein [Flagellimonas flava]|uniref:YceI-like domain-containing protein n=1 Tax=Flagellimonas flava TaxID=570519 RepID=A0A1M5K0A6_9FLAO|nr:YceI family protein [Allomuricauda flava]SHG46221.1 YceI-like domain-containing protein [Allomuricauda flava]